MEKSLDLLLSSEYDLIVGKNKTLNSIITATYLNTTGGTEYFEFSGYTGASLTVKNNAGTVLMNFDTSDGSIVLQTNGQFRLVKSATEMDGIRAGVYNYNMDLHNAQYPKRAFLRGKITWIQNYTN